MLSQSLENRNRDEELLDLLQGRDTDRAANRRREALIASPQRQLPAPGAQPPSPETPDPATGARDDVLG